ncbi:MAG: hypothetical protein DCF17_06910 [Shackletoniella antarctica]|uniref:Uncharacterized protein n=1 Tax=Shackletoniella antarctica TaxID=268115 RepID=A0A2W4WIJ8_9CYAN|nr:MAG: hypothetical protein DCF17_06910 [Shackletoniella antarctica]
MSEQFIHGYALLIGVGSTVDPRLSLPVTVKDALAVKTILTDPHLCAYPNDANHVRLLHDQGTTRNAVLDGLDWLAEKASADQGNRILIECLYW